MFWNLKKYIYICSPLEMTGILVCYITKIADVAQLARAADL